MPESRDRISRPVDVAAIFARRRAGILGIYEGRDEIEMALFGPRTAAATAAGPGSMYGVGIGGGGRGGWGLGTPRSASGRGRENAVFNTPSGSARRGNGRGRGRGSGSVLPSWYPRTPLRDITAVVRAIERRRERLGGSEGQEFGSPTPEAGDAPGSSETPAVAHLEHSNKMKTPAFTPRLKRCPPTVGKVPKILHDVANQDAGDSEFLTPQKKLLNSIDKVEKVVMEELQKLKRTPSARRVEREKRVRTLMSMR